METVGGQVRLFEHEACNTSADFRVDRTTIGETLATLCIVFQMKLMISPLYASLGCSRFFALGSVHQTHWHRSPVAQQPYRILSSQRHQGPSQTACQHDANPYHATI